MIPEIWSTQKIEKYRLQITREWQASVFPKFTLRLLPQFPFSGIAHEYSLRRIDSVENFSVRLIYLVDL